jgi:hypothetical protein
LQRPLQPERKKDDPDRDNLYLTLQYLNRAPPAVSGLVLQQGKYLPPVTGDQGYDLLPAHRSKPKRRCQLERTAKPFTFLKPWRRKEL